MTFQQKRAPIQSFQNLQHAKRKLRLALHREPQVGQAGPGDDDLNPGATDPIQGGSKDAAVLLPIVARRELSVILTVRTEHLAAHAGQISFPGGKVDAGERAHETALREAHEEIGLQEMLVEPLGFLDSYRTRTGFTIYPMVGVVAPEFDMTINRDEVAEVFEVPLAFLIDPQNHQQHSRRWEGQDRYFYAMPYGERFIWGATAGIIRNLYERLTRA